MILKTNQVERFKGQPRIDFDEEYIDSLAKSIKTVGQKTPIIVRELTDTTYELISGENRLRACIKHDMEMICAIVEQGNMSQKEQFITAVMANEHGKRHTHYELFRSIQKMMEEYEMSVEEVMSVYGKSDAWVYDYYALRKLAPELQESLERVANTKHYLRFKDAKLLARIADHAKQLDIYEQTRTLPPHQRHARIKKLVREEKPPQRRKKRVRGVADCRKALSSLLDRISIGSETIMDMPDKTLKSTLADLGTDENTMWQEQIDECIANLSILKQELEASTASAVLSPVSQETMSELRN